MKYWTEVVSSQTLSGPFYLEAYGQVVRSDLRIPVSKLDSISLCDLYPGRVQCLL